MMYHKNGWQGTDMVANLRLDIRKDAPGNEEEFVILR